jgi:hypothetical protein
MSYPKTTVCLANYRKDSSWCVAGLEAVPADFGAWIKPVSARPEQEISAKERLYKAGRYLEILDIFGIQMQRPVSHLHRKETMSLRTDSIA